MNQKQKKEILLLGLDNNALSSFSEIMTDFFDVHSFNNVDELKSATSPDNSVIIIPLEGNYLDLLKECRTKCPAERVIGIYDGNIKDFIEVAIKNNLNSLISINLSMDKLPMARMINSLFRKNVHFGVGLSVSKNSKVLKTSIKSPEALYSLIAKVSSFISNIRKISPETLIKIITPIVTTAFNLGKETEMTYALEHTRLAFHFNINFLDPLQYPSSFYKNAFGDVKGAYSALKESIGIILTEADEFTFTLLNDRSELLVVYYLKNEDLLGKSFSLPGNYDSYKKPEQSKDSKVDGEKEEVSLSTGDVKEDFEAYLSSDSNLLSIDFIKKTEGGRQVLEVDLKLDLPDVDMQKVSPHDAIKKYQEQIDILKSKITEVAKKFYEANIRMKRAEEVAEVIGTEIKLLMKQRKEPTTDQELKEIKMKLELQIDKLYRDIGIEKAKNKKLVKQIELLKQDLLTERMERDKLNAIIRDKEREIKELDAQLSLAIKSSSDF